MRTGRPSKIKWTQEQTERIKRDYAKLGPNELARQMGIDDVQCLNNRANYLGLKSKTLFKWTKELNEVLTARFQIDGPTVLAKELGIPYWTLFGQCKRLGLGLTRKAPVFVEWTEEKLQVIRDRYVEEGGEILAELFGCELRMIQDRAGEMGLHTNAGHKRWGDERAKNNTSCDIHYFEKWSPNMAYILGFLFADGNVNKELTCVGVGVKRSDEAVIEFIKKELKSKLEIRREEAKVDTRTGALPEPASLIGLHSKVLVQSVLKLGLRPRKTFEDHPFPEVPDEMMPHFVRGYFDGDGTVGNGEPSGSVGFVGSPRFIEGLRDSLVRLLGITNRQVGVHQGKTAAWCDVVWNAHYDIKKLHDFMYPEGFTFCYKRKKERFDSWFTAPNGRGYILEQRALNR